MESQQKTLLWVAPQNEEIHHSDPDVKHMLNVNVYVTPPAKTCKTKVMDTKNIHPNHHGLDLVNFGGKDFGILGFELLANQK